jgi:hypothetical protein
MDGDELAHRLRKRWPGLKVLYLTGYSDRPFVEQAALHEGEAFLGKPCSIEGLGRMVALLSGGRPAVNRDAAAAAVEASR